MSDANDKLSPEMQKVFEGLRQLPLEADPYLESRVLAQLRERRGQGKQLLRWKRLAIGASAFSVLAVALLVFRLTGETTYEAFVDRPFVVRIELKSLNQDKIAKAKIELPPGVHFDLEDYPDLKDQSELTLHWTRQEGAGVFPFVLSATEPGSKTVRVKFFDEHDGLVAERVFQLKLRPPEPKSGGHA